MVWNAVAWVAARAYAGSALARRAGAAPRATVPPTRSPAWLLRATTCAPGTATVFVTCATCENPLCANAEPCVLCHLSNNCSETCSIGNVNYTVSESYREDGMECEYRYTYKAAAQAMIAMDIVIRYKECFQPTSAKIVTSALITMACVILGGVVIILAVKSAQIVSDRRAYAKFLQEAEESRKHMQELNPLYISPISEFRLPEGFARDKND
ncbi:unnamed protein product [Leptidea sinapis]|uniref:Integrin beta subunit cytoplasmic domain-containing protein n=1 Tax=Leptidea sinapis TaxID=189913 RepID=A0A5E4Q9E2_9NEOP|nr:unnamed protein product [Leptidea sinapis]